MRRDGDEDFEFSRWATLAKSDPEAFERARRAAVEALIAGAPPDVRRRLEGVQWRVDRVRELAPHPLAACVRVSRMMWESVAGHGGLLDRLDELSRTVSGERVPARPRAEVLPLETPPEREG